jgi:hypothetical protein
MALFRDAADRASDNEQAQWVGALKRVRAGRATAPPQRLAKHFASSGLDKQNTTNSLSGVREMRRGLDTGGPKYRLTVLEAPHLFGRKHNMVWPFGLKPPGGESCKLTLLSPRRVSSNISGHLSLTQRNG